MWWEVILDALKDTAILFPFLFLMYVLIELMEHNTQVGKPNRAFSGKCAPLLGSATGLLPMCGFSVMAAKLYRHRHITLGTLFAVLLASSDEALLVLLASPALGWAQKAIVVPVLLASKFVIGVAAGYAVDWLFRKSKTPPAEIPQDLHEHERHHEHDHGEHEEDGHEHYTPCEHKHESKWHLYLISPLLHALEIAAFVLLVNLTFGYLFFAVGEETVIEFLQTGRWIQPVVCCLIAVVPNCASSVLLAETFCLGGITFSSLLGGLVTNVGIAYLVFFRKKESVKSGVLLVLSLFLTGVFVGYLANALEPVIPILH